MDHISRRNAVKLTALGALGTVMAGLSKSAIADQQADEVRAAEGVSYGPLKADVRQCKSWDGTCHLTIDDNLAGYVKHLNDDIKAFAILAACEAAGVKVNMTYTDHVPGRGGGEFKGVRVAIREDVF